MSMQYITYVPFSALKTDFEGLLADLQLLSELFEVCLFTRYINHVSLATLV